jgi:hypothetical protein
LLRLGSQNPGFHPKIHRKNPGSGGFPELIFQKKKQFWKLSAPEKKKYFPQKQKISTPGL